MKLSGKNNSDTTLIFFGIGILPLQLSTNSSFVYIYPFLCALLNSLQSVSVAERTDSTLINETVSVCSLSGHLKCQLITSYHTAGGSQSLCVNTNRTNKKNHGRGGGYT